MLKAIRRGVFETNSSSTHSISIVSEEDYNRFENGELLIVDRSELVTKEEAIEELKNDKWFIKNNPNFDFTDIDAVNEALRDNGYETSDQYWDDEYLETYSESYTTKNGEKFIAFGKYGYNG